MLTAKIFENGRSQAVRLPKEYRFKEDEVAINKIGDIVFLLPKEDKWAGFLESFKYFTEDFLNDESSFFISQEREEL
ncbi:MAG: AbrB/MazE/SpoVT family DNA-binding domain-containing protein [Lachnospiraceae bacterium]|nr:AbrB/MazE/SpoVT family DNA-binding domain-containing protein [Lachnospiraceae bacterium]